MAANLGFVVQAAEAESNKFAIQRARDRTSERSFTDARRADETKDRALWLFAQLANGERFDDSFLYAFETVMVFVEDLLGLFQIEIVL